MRGRREPQAAMPAFVDLEERVPQGHTIRTIKIIADETLEGLFPWFDQMYSKVGRAPVTPERLLRASLFSELTRCAESEPSTRCSNTTCCSVGSLS